MKYLKNIDFHHSKGTVEVECIFKNDFYGSVLAESRNKLHIDRTIKIAKKINEVLPSGIPKFNTNVKMDDDDDETDIIFTEDIFPEGDINLEFQAHDEGGPPYIRIAIGRETFESVGIYEREEKIKIITTILEKIDDLTGEWIKRVRDLQNGEMAGILREPAKTVGLAPEGSALDKVFSQGILPKNVGRFLTEEEITGTSIKPTLSNLHTKATRYKEEDAKRLKEALELKARVDAYAAKGKGRKTRKARKTRKNRR